jgi:hypothetical protein
VASLDRPGIKTLMPQLLKAALLRVASVAPVRRAMAAICASNWLSGRPARRREQEISA